MNCVSQSIPSEMGEKHEQKHAGVFREVKWRGGNACLVKFYGSLLVGACSKNTFNDLIDV